MVSIVKGSLEALGNIFLSVNEDESISELALELSAHALDLEILRVDAIVTFLFFFLI